MVGTHGSTGWTSRSCHPSLIHTAVRENREVTGVDLDGLEAHLGRLVEGRPYSLRISITPHVFGAPAETPPRVASAEV